MQAEKMDELKREITLLLEEHGIEQADSFKGKLDSITFIELIVALETRYDIMFETENLLLENYGTLEDICASVLERMEGRGAETEAVQDV